MLAPDVDRGVAQTPGGRVIGIIADSHGRADALVGALTDLRRAGCETIYHLGDICDSAHPETADACVALLREHDVIGLLGNNDDALLANREGRVSAAVKPETLTYLERLPLVLERADVLLCHSLPFERELGRACMIRDLDHDQARLFFARHPRQVLFRGHGHSPALTWLDGAHDVCHAELAPGALVRLAAKGPCIVTCGALERGFSMTWSPATATVECRGP